MPALFFSDIHGIIGAVPVLVLVKKRSCLYNSLWEKSQKINQ